MNNLTSADSISAVFMESEEFRDSPLCPLFTLCSIYAGDAISSDDLSGEKAIPVYGSNGIRSYADKANHLEDQVLVGRQGSVGTVHFAEAPFWAAEHALIVEPRTSRVSKSWLKYVLEAMDLSRLSRAVAQPGINATSVSFQRVPHIPFEQQKVIGDYLDRETAEIDAAVADLDKYVDLLESRKIEKLKELIFADNEGEFPLIPVQLLFRKISSGSTPKGEHFYAESGNGVPWVTTSELREKIITETKKNVTPQAVEKVSGLVVFPRDTILIAMYGATIGRFGRLGVNATSNQACCALIDPIGIDPEFFYYSLYVHSRELVKQAFGGGQPNINQDTIRRFRAPVPSLAKQKKIAREMKIMVAETEDIIAESTKLRDLLLKRRSVLIAEVATGRKRV